MGRKPAPPFLGAARSEYGLERRSRSNPYSLLAAPKNGGAGFLPIRNKYHLPNSPGLNRFVIA
jgi:hypothetical protein